MRTFSAIFMLTTAVLTAGKELLLLAFYLVAHLATGHYTEEAKRRARATRLWTLLQATGTERKVLLFEYLVYGPVDRTYGPGRVMTDLFGAITEPDEPDDLDEDNGETLNVLLATRYDKELEAAFYLEALLDPCDLDGETLEYQTIFTPMGYAGKRRGRVFYAIWPDSTLALMSYYGNGSAEVDAIGLDIGPDDKDYGNGNAA